MFLLIIVCTKYLVIVFQSKLIPLEFNNFKREFAFTESATSIFNCIKYLQGLEDGFPTLKR